jgi:hypothetical protein
VEVEMVLREVREDERAEADAVEPTELRAVGRRLDRRAAVARVQHLPKGALEVDRLRGGADRRPPLAAHPALDRAEQPGPPVGRGKDCVEQERGGRLAVRPGDAGHIELLRRAAEELVGSDGHRAAGVLDDELRHRELERTLDDERDRAVCDGVRREGMAVGARSPHAEVKTAGPRFLGVVDEVGDLHRHATDDVDGRERVDQELEVHRGASLPSAVAEAASSRHPRTAHLQHFCDTSAVDTRGWSRYARLAEEAARTTPRGGTATRSGRSPSWARPGARRR